MFVLGYFLLGIRFNFSKIFKLPNSHQEIQKHITFVLDLSHTKKIDRNLANLAMLDTARAKGRPQLVRWHVNQA
jgi:hypothetical protein